MIDKINGGIYAVDLGGTENYEFQGVHPALIVRTLKEKNMYVVVPLTTYNEDRWEKCKKIGYGARIISTNSIARIDKINVVTDKQIQGRYYNAGKMVVPTYDEIEKVLTKVEKYISLSHLKASNEYNKYLGQREEFANSIKIIFSLDNNIIFPYNMSIGDTICVNYPKSKLSAVSNADIKAIICENIDNEGISIKKSGDNIQIDIDLNSDKLLTLKKEYDRLDLQKGGSDA